MKSILAARLLLILAIVASMASILSPKSPAPLPASAPADQFSAERAREIVAAIAREPHPIGSAANARVREELARRLRALGLEPQVQVTTAVQKTTAARASGGSGVRAGRVANLMARLPGTRSGAGKAVLLMAHYDSVPHGPGASDDAAGCAALLETLRALKSSAPLERDLIFLFTDGEEAGLLGAEAFAEEHPWAKEVGLVLNFEARGTEGPVFMFETSQGNGQLIATLGKAASHPIASSYSGEIYKRMPNDTDFSVFRDRGYQGLNFAYIHHQSAYHTAQDSLERMSLSTLQHHGDYALSLARAFGNGAEPSSAVANAVSFNLLGATFVHYPGEWVMPLAVVAGLLTLGVLAVGIRRRRASPLGTVAAAFLWLISTALLAYLFTLAGSLFFSGFYDFRVWGGRSSLSLTLLSVAVVALGLGVGLYRLLARWFSGESLLAGGLLVWLALTVAMSLVAPGASALFLWPLMAALPAAWWWFREPAPAEPGRAWVLLAALPVLVAALIWANLLASIGVALAQGAGPLIAGSLVLLLALCALTLAWGRTERGGWKFPLVAALAGLVLLVAVRSASRFGGENLRPGALTYVLDTESGQALWLTYAGLNDPWAKGIVGATGEPKPQPDFMRGGWPMYQGPAPSIEAPRPAASLLRLDGSKGELSLRWQLPPDRLILRLPARGALALDGRTLKASQAEPGAPQVIEYFGVPAQGVKLELALADEKPVEVELVAQYYGFTRVPGLSLSSRPADSMPLPTPWTDSMVFSSKYAVPVTEPVAPMVTTTTPPV